MTDRKRKSTIVCLSSSSQEEEEEEEEEDSEFEKEDDQEIRVIIPAERIVILLKRRRRKVILIMSTRNGSDRDDKDGGSDNEESSCKRVSRFLIGSDLKALQLKECKAYLRKYGFRLAGAKAVCIQRIKEHYRLKDGDGEAFYPRSSFVIDCRGDVCKGDVVLFSQKFYERFNKVTRHGKLLGKRTVAGRVIKESYGSAKQQHTFTVEVLWSKGIKQLPPLFSLLVKGRNLYRFNTFRQRWDDEAERLKVFAEKHQRGTEARFVRTMKKSKRMGSPNIGLKRQKCSYDTRPFQMGKTVELEKRKNVKAHRKGMLRHSKKFNNHGQEALPSRQLKFKRAAGSEGLNSSWSYRKVGHLNNDMGLTIQSYPTNLHNQHFSQKVFESRR